LSEHRIALNKMRVVKIAEIRDEADSVKSFTFYDGLCSKAEPGQFVMVWIPGVDEVPMSLSGLNPRTRQVMITVERVGQATKALHKMKVGDLIGLRGPLGNSYTTLRVHDAMIVGGGTGLASLAPLAEKLAKRKTNVTFMIGAKTKSNLLFLDRVSQLVSKDKGRVIAATEDGSHGFKGLITEPAETMLRQGEKFDVIYACGPEPMMYKMFLLSERFRIRFQASLERFMRCAIGLCGTCVIGRYCVCHDGPVFSGQQLREVKDEFGRFRRGFDGGKIPA